MNRLVTGGCCIWSLLGSTYVGERYNELVEYGVDF